MFKLYNVSKTYSNGFQALKGVSFKTPKTGLFTITGDSGSGKSTLLNLLSGIDSFNGKISCDGYTITMKNSDLFRRKYISNIFQDFKLIEGMTVENNIALGAESVGIKCTHDDVVKLLNDVGLSEDNYKKNITELSGGERQRVSIARALAKDTPIILADEPTGNLDKNNSRKIFELLKKISTTKLVMTVTHNDILSREFSDGNIHLDDGEIVVGEESSQNLYINNTIRKRPKSVSKKHEVPKIIPKTKEKLSIKTMCKLNYMTGKNRMLNAMFTTLSVLMLFVTFCTASLLNIDSLTVTIRSLANTDYKIASIEKMYSPFEGSDFGEQVYYSFDTRIKIELGFNPNSNDHIIIFNAGYDIDINSVVECNDVANIGLDIIYGENVLDYDEIVISEYLAINILRVGSMSGHTVNSYEDLIGLQIQSMNIVGISSSDLDKYKGEYADATYAESGNLESGDMERISELIPIFGESVDCDVAFVKEGYSENTRNNVDSLNAMVRPLYFEFYTSGNRTSYYPIDIFDDEIATAIDVEYVDPSHTQLLNGQLLISYEMKVLMESEGYLKGNVLTTRVDDRENKYIDDKYDVIGYYESQGHDVYMSVDSYKDLESMYAKIYNAIYFNGDTVDLEKLYNSFESKFVGTKYTNNTTTLQTVVSHGLVDSVDGLSGFYDIALVVHIVFVLMASLFLIINIYSFIKSKKRDIVVLRMIGISKKSVALPIMFYFVALFLMEVVAAIGLCIGAMALLNLMVKRSYTVFYNLLNFNALVVPILMAVLLIVVVGTIAFYVNNQYSKNALDKYNE